MLAAWGRMVRGRLNNRQSINLTTTVSDARRAAQGFEALGAARNAGRARIFEASTLLDIATDEHGKESQRRRSRSPGQGIADLALSVDPALSAFERALSPFMFLGIHAYNVSNFSDARANWQAAKSAFEAIGNRSCRRTVLQNLAALAFEEGDYQAAAQQFDLLIAELDQVVVDRVTNGAAAQRRCRRYQHRKCRARDRAPAPSCWNLRASTNCGRGKDTRSVRSGTPI